LGQRNFKQQIYTYNLSPKSKRNHFSLQTELNIKTILCSLSLFFKMLFNRCQLKYSGHYQELSYTYSFKYAIWQVTVNKLFFYCVFYTWLFGFKKHNAARHQWLMPVILLRRQRLEGLWFKASLGK
jgi:hypothetical protein